MTSYYVYSTTDASPFGLDIPTKRKGAKPDAEPKAPAKFIVQRDGATLSRRLLDDAAAQAWLAATDADGRAAVLAAIEPTEMDRPPHPALDVWNGMLALLGETPRTALLALLSEGTFILPVRPRGNAKAAASPAERTAAALDAIFGPEPTADADAPAAADADADAPKGKVK